MRELVGDVIQLTYSDFVCIGLKREPSYMGTIVRIYRKMHQLSIHCPTIRQQMYS